MSAAWRTDAACADCGEAELFDPLGEREPAEQMMDRAKRAVARYCATCPVMELCHAEAELHEYLGVWGGCLRERRHVRRLLWAEDRRPGHRRARGRSTVSLGPPPLGYRMEDC